MRGLASGCFATAAFCLALAWTGSASAQDCVLGPVAVPGLYGPPVWFGAAGGTNWRPQLHDPRWSGAPMGLFSFTPAGMEADDATFRMLHDGNYLYVAMYANVDDAGVDYADAAYFAFTIGTAGTNAFAVAIVPDGTTAPVDPPDASVPTDTVLPVSTSDGYVSWYETTDSTTADPTWTEHAGAIPGWLDNVATWRGSPGVAWAVTFRVNLADPTVAASGPMRVYHAARVNNSGGVITFGAPSTPALAAADAITNTIIPESSGDFCGTGSDACWRPIQAPGSACSAGITISPANVGVWNGTTLVNQFQACGPGGTPCPAAPASITNQIRMRVQNVPSTGVTDYIVRTRVRIADWGSTIADPNAPWEEIPGFTPNVFTALQSTLTSDSNWGWSYNSGTGEATVDYTCTANEGDYCPKLLNSALEDHQCMLVELAAAPGAGPDFKNFARAAVYRNMNYVGLSTVSMPATISIAGLKKAIKEAGDRDVYLHVRTTNMPPHGEKPVWLDAKAMSSAISYAEHPPAIPTNRYDKKRLKRRPMARLAAARKEVDHSNTVPVLSYPTMSAEQALSAAWPMYQVRVYYDTGRTLKIKDQERKVLQPMVPFGFYSSHAGPLYGFTHAIEGLDGAALKEIAPNWYRVRIKGEGSIRIRTTITAEEKPRPNDGGGPSGTGGASPCPTCPPPVEHRVICNCRVPGGPGGATHLGGGALVAIAFLAHWRRRAGRTARGRRANGRRG